MAAQNPHTHSRTGILARFAPHLHPHERPAPDRRRLARHVRLRLAQRPRLAVAGEDVRLVLVRLVDSLTPPPCILLPPFSCRPSHPLAVFVCTCSPFSPRSPAFSSPVSCHYSRCNRCLLLSACVVENPFLRAVRRLLPRLPLLSLSPLTRSTWPAQTPSKAESPL